MYKHQGRIQGGPRGQDPPPPFGGPPNFIKREKMLCVCAQMQHILVVNSYPEPPLSEIPYLPLNMYRLMYRPIYGQNISLQIGPIYMVQHLTKLDLNELDNFNIKMIK